MGRLHSLGVWWGAALLGLSQRWVIWPSSPGLPWSPCFLPSEAALSLAVIVALEP